MKLVDKYLLREYLVPVLYCLTAFCLMYVVIDLFSRISELLEHKTSVFVILHFYVNYLFAINGNSAFVVLVLPVCLLLGVLYSLAQLTRHNELTAMRASGMSLVRLMRPYLAVGVGCSLVCAVVQETVTPRASRWLNEFERALNRESRQTVLTDFPYYNSSVHRNWLIHEFNPSRPHRLIGVKVIQERPDGTRSEEIQADRAEWLDGSWWFFGCRTVRYGPNSEPTGPRSAVADHPVEMPDLTEDPSDFANEVERWEILSSLEMYQYIRVHPDLSRENRARLWVDLYSRLAMPWTCIVVILLGVPTGARTGRQGMLAGVILAIALFFCFYAVVHFGIFMGKRQVIWPWLAAWLPNMAFSAAGVIALLRMR